MGAGVLDAPGPRGDSVVTGEEARALARLSALRCGRTELHETTWPWTTARLKLRVLTSADLQEALGAAHARFAELGIPLTEQRGHLEDEIIVQALFRACRSAEDPAVAFAASAEDLREQTTAQERAIVYREFEAFQVERNPRISDLDEEVWTEIQRIVKGRGHNQADLYRVAHAQDLFAYFGRAAVDLTDYEVCFYALLRAELPREGGHGHDEDGVRTHAAQQFQVPRGRPGSPFFERTFRRTTDGSSKE